MSVPPQTRLHGQPGAAQNPEYRSNGPELNPMQPSSGYGFYPPHYSVPPGNYPAINNTKTPLHVNNLYGADYYSANYSGPSQNVVTSAVQPHVLSAHQIPSSMHSRSFPQPHPMVYTHGTSQGIASYSTSYVNASVSHPYPTLAGHINNSARHPPGSQEFPLLSGPYTTPAATSDMYSSVSYPSMPVTNQYGQVLTSHSLPPVGQFTGTTLYGQTGTECPPSKTPTDYSITRPALGQQNKDNIHQKHPLFQEPPNNTIRTESALYLAGVSSHSTEANVVVSSMKPAMTVAPSVNSGSVGPSTEPDKPALPEGMQYGEYVNNHASSALTPLSSSTDDEDEEDDEEEDEEEAGVETSSTTSSATPVSNNYDALEGGGYSEFNSSFVSGDSPSHSVSQTSKPAKPFGYGYPSLQPGYRNSVPPTSSAPSSMAPYRSEFQPYAQQYPATNQLSSSLGGLSLQSSQQPECLRPVNLTQERNILPISPIEAPVPNLNPDLKKLNCSSHSFRCTLTNIPQTQALLNKAKLPLGLLLHPFRDLTQLPVITSSTIVRCRSCRTYINPFVSFIDQRRWKCSLCYRVNDVPEEFMYNPLTRSYGEPHKRPEVQNSTVEFIASSDYMLRPPQPAVYLFVMDVSHNAIEAGYLAVVCQSLLEHLEKLPGDSRTRIGFITFDSTVHFYNLQEGLSQPQMFIVSDIDDIFLPTPDSLLVNLHESKELIVDLLNALPNIFINTRETHSALGPALQAAYKLMSPTGGRISVFQSQLPSIGAGTLQSREDPNQRSSTKFVQHLGPATDFYKKLALDCSGQQTAVDLFLLSSQYSDLASLACVSKYSAGCIYYYPSFHSTHNPEQTDKLQKDLKRYLTRKIGFEAVMRIRCTKGLSIHTFHGNFFVRSTDLLSLANINPDAGFAVQMSIEESLTDTSLVCFQTAVLYTSSKGERRIRVHTLCLPVVTSLSDVYAGCDIQAIVCLLANMAVDRSISSSLSDARDALLNAVVDSLSAYSSTLSHQQQSTLLAPVSLKLFPLYILALLKQKAFRTGTSTRLDDRVYAMCQMKSQPLALLMKMIYPSLYRIDRLIDEGTIHVNDKTVPQPVLRQLSAEILTREGAFLMDCGSILYLWVGKRCDDTFIKDVLGFPNYSSVPQKLMQLPELDTLISERTRSFISWLRDSRPSSAALHVVKDDTAAATDFFQHLIEDKTGSSYSYYDFLLHIQQQFSK
ncbi:protein transport protein Sec24B isoform X4 [Pleurodeles waltl]|uniref:protein transport protein Sec24B isoform X4 n=1 Tax=Pleurodeles waltl TaxID=8319 RepID=UPI003709BB38